MISSASIDAAKRSKYRVVMSKQGLIAYDKSIPLTIRFDEKETCQALKRNIDFSKYDHYCEVAHLEISDRCNMSCKYCYVGDKGGQELGTTQWKKIILNLARGGVFQVSFGGGEPTMRNDLFQLAQYVNDVGLNLGMTSNGIRIPTLNAVALRKYFRQINISWHQDEKIVKNALEFLVKHKIPCGINYAFSREMAKDDERVKKLAKKFKAELLYLVYKPVVKDTANQVPSSDVYAAAKKAANEGCSVAVDGPCVNQCLMKRKFIDVNHAGDVYPCSFVRKSLGNLLKTDFKEIWKTRGEQEDCPFVDLKKEMVCG